MNNYRLLRNVLGPYLLKISWLIIMTEKNTEEKIVTALLPGRADSHGSAR